jgi:hypothetical protein
MTQSCRTCRDLSCPNIGQDRAACEDHVPSPEHAHSGSAEQRIENLQHEVNHLAQRVSELEDWVSDFQAAVVRRVQGL